MKKDTWYFFVLSIFVLFLLLSGCEMIVPPVTYEATPTRMRYDLSYGYYVNITKIGRYEITYLCDTPEVLLGTVTYDVLYKTDYQRKNLFNNTMICWNISEKNATSYVLGINARIDSENFFIADLNGKDALTIRQIHEYHPQLVTQYTQLQGNETIRFIDPVDTNIRAIADAVYTNEKTNNSFLVAKSLFAWLKQNIIYQAHPNEQAVRSSTMTLVYKQGDCDDISFLYIALCRALDIPARYIRGYLIAKGINGAITATPHAWVEVFVGQPESLDGWIPIECACCTTSIVTDIQQNFGIESANHLRLFTDDGSNVSLASSLSGISYITHEPDTLIFVEPFAHVSNYQELASQKLIITPKNNRLYE